MPITWKERARLTYWLLRGRGPDQLAAGLAKVRHGEKPGEAEESQARKDLFEDFFRLRPAPRDRRP